MILSTPTAFWTGQQPGVPRSLSRAEGGPGKQVTTTGVGPGNISRWKLFFLEKFEFEERGYFTQKN